MTDVAHPVLLDVADGVATLTLNRPDKLNTFVPELGRLMIEHLERLKSDASVRVVVGSARAVTSPTASPPSSDQSPTPTARPDCATSSTSPSC